MTEKSEISYPVHVTDIPRSGLVKKISGTPTECEALAQLLSVEDVVSVDAEFKIARWHKEGLRISAHIIVDVVQNCVVSLEPISSHLEEREEWKFKPETATRPGKNEKLQDLLLIDPFGEDPADILEAGQIDLFALLSEHLCLMIDPFVRSPSIEFDDVYNQAVDHGEPVEEKVSPFAILKQGADKDAS